MRYWLKGTKLSSKEIRGTKAGKGQDICNGGIESSDEVKTGTTRMQQCDCS